MTDNNRTITIVKANRSLATPKTPLVILADVSGSMRGKKHEELTRAVARILGERNDATLYAFNDEVFHVPEGLPLPMPYCGTALEKALKVAKKHNPERVLIVTDGHPNSHHEALSAADALGWTRVDVLFIGESASAREFCCELIRNGGRLISEASNMLPNITLLLENGGSSIAL
jgi:hypothetical protein